MAKAATGGASKKKSTKRAKKGKGTPSRGNVERLIAAGLLSRDHLPPAAVRRRIESLSAEEMRVILAVLRRVGGKKVIRPMFY